MGVQFGSNLDVNSIITGLLALERRPLDLLNRRKANIDLQQKQFTAVSTRAQTLLDSLKKLTTSTSGTDLFKKRETTSSNADLVTATAGDNATNQAFQVRVDRLATSTKAISSSTALPNGVGQFITGTSLLSTVTQTPITAGTFTLSVNGTQSAITVNTGDTFDDVLNRITSAFPAISSAIVNASGQIELAYAPGTTIQLGGNADTSNFLQAMALDIATPGATSTVSVRSATSLNRNVSLTEGTNAAGLATAVNAGTFTIGNATFDTTGKSLNQLISEINNNNDAGVIATFNQTTNRLELSARNTGPAVISLAEGSSNFLTALGLIVGGDASASQTLGQTSQIELNGNTIIASSNTLGPAVTGLTDVTLNLLKADNATTATLNVKSTTSDLKSTLKEFVTNFNQLVSFIDEQTNAQSTTAVLKGDTALLRFRTQLRQKLSEAVTGSGKYDNLASIGISTGSPSASASGSASSTVSLDESKLEAALLDNPEAVRTLLVGSSGILTQLQTKLTRDLTNDPDPLRDGLFAARNENYQDRVKQLTAAISRGEDRLLVKEKLLRDRFTAMDKVIGQLQSQGSAISNLNRNLS